MTKVKKVQCTFEWKKETHDPAINWSRRLLFVLISHLLLQSTISSCLFHTQGFSFTDINGYGKNKNEKGNNNLDMHIFSCNLLKENKFFY